MKVTLEATGRGGGAWCERDGKMYAKIIPDASSDTLMRFIEHKVVPDSIVYSDGWKGDNALDVSDFHHFHINHSERLVDD